MPREVVRSFIPSLAAVTALLGVMAGSCADSAPPGMTVVNDTDQSLRIVSRHEMSGQPPSTTPARDDIGFSVPAGQESGTGALPFNAAGCVNWVLLAYDANNKLVAQLQAPICKVDGDVKPWTITLSRKTA